MVASYQDRANPSSLHKPGRDARRVAEESRERLAALIGARPSEIIWTSGGTEADNLAIKGLYWSRQTPEQPRKRILISAIEHHAVLDPAFWLAEHAGAELTLLPVDEVGRLDTAALAEEINRTPQQIALVAVMWANNEIGTVQPLAEVVALAHRHGIPVHADAVQVLGQLPIDFGAVGLDTMALSAHKVGGPGSVGALVAGRSVALTPVLHGGGQERGVRSGTIDAPAAAGFAAAAEAAVHGIAEHTEKLRQLQIELIDRITREIPGARLSGPADLSERLPANVHFTFTGCEGDSLLYLLDAGGVSASSGSACQAGVPQPSHVLMATGLDEHAARGALRFSFGHTSSRADIDKLMSVLPDAVARARSVGSLTAAAAGNRK